MNPIDLIASWDIPVENEFLAVSAIRNHDPASGRVWTPELSEDDMLERITEVLRLKTKVGPYESAKHTRVIYGYTIQEAVKRFSSDEETPTPTTMGEFYHDVLEKSRKHIGNSPWVVMEWEVEQTGEPKMDAAGNPKQKKGAKKEMALKVYEANKHNTDLTRQDWIKLLMDEVGMTKAGASTYYANLKKGKL